VLAYTAAPGASLEEFSAARTFVWGGAGGGNGAGAPGSIVESYRDDATASDIHRSQHHTDEKLTAPGAAYRIADVL
jgi:hypothetical protein